MYGERYRYTDIYLVWTEMSRPNLLAKNDAGNLKVGEGRW